MKMQSITICLLVAIPIYLLFGCIIFPQWKNYERLAHAGTRTSGKVIAKEPDNHQGVRYEYSVDSKMYFGSSCASFGGLPPFSQIEIGDEIPVTYWSVKPDVSVPGDPADLFGSWSVLLFGVLPLFSLIAGSVSAFRARKGRSPS